MKMESSIFEYLLNPNRLVEELPSMSESDVISSLRHVLGLLQNEKSKNAAAMANTDGGDNGGPLAPPTYRKQAVIQMLILQLTCKLQWNISKLNQHINVGLQHQLLDCLIAACQVREMTCVIFLCLNKRKCYILGAKSSG